MLTAFIAQNLKRAKYKLLEDGTFYGWLPTCRGVWANAKNLETCRKELSEVLESWLLLKIRDRQPVSGFKFNQRLAVRHA